LNRIVPNDGVGDIRRVQSSGDPSQAILDLFHGSLNPFPQGITSVFDFNHVALPQLNSLA